ncbi:MAG: LacI family DNA-binding transcriptional regulator [Butyrivibrio sp.]|nr:LacI family DNA-binding transcriptional regulator [Butyrivibrio sp.]
MVSLKDIAKACGVSVATVSKAINDHSDISRETKDRIRETANQMGYRPNAAAQALKTNRSNNIGVLFVDAANSGLTHDYFNHVLDSFKRTAEDNGFDITFINGAKNSMNNMSYLSHAIYRGFDGVVIACVDFSDPQVDELIKSNIPVVTIDHLFNNRIAVVSDNIRGMKDIVDYVYEMGHRKIAYVHGDESSVTQSRLSSFYKTLEEHGIEVNDDYVVSAPYRNTEASFKATEKLLDLPEPPTCILYPDDFAAFGGMNAIRQRGLKIPEDVSVVGYDGIEIARRISPILTTLVQDTEKIGSIAANKLINLINNPKSTLIEQIIVDGTIEKGESVARIGQ